jgi:aminoglycoside phosphotransferase (APT) family kinase protein
MLRTARGGTEGVRVDAGIDAGRVSEWLVDHVGGVRAPFRFDLIAGGRSNLTFSVVDAAGRRLVLRRPPLGHVLESAHDVGREHRIIAALWPTDVPVAEALGFCADPAVNGAPFYVMSFVEGPIVRDLEVGRAVFTEEQRRAAGESLVDVLAALHAVDPDAVGLGDLGRKEGYIERQLRRWLKQFEGAKTREIPEIEEVHDRLAARIPIQDAAGIVHGDYRLDNCVSRPDGPVAAVLDWELCTLGDVRADLGMLSICWADPDEPITARPDAATQLPGFPSRREAMARYEQVSGRDLSDLPFYEAFQFWRLACIGEGVYARYKFGAMGDQHDVNLDFIAEGPPRSARTALEILEAN